MIAIASNFKAPAVTSCQGFRDSRVVDTGARRILQNDRDLYQPQADSRGVGFTTDRNSGLTQIQGRIHPLSCDPGGQWPPASSKASLVALLPAWPKAGRYV
jgi:hypothetical protein